jgi:hypothetical protein
MSQDRFIKYKENPKPEDVGKALEGYLNGAATVTWEGDRWFVFFPQKPSNPIRDLNPSFYFVREGDRWFEVVCNPRCSFDVLTRQQDEFVNAVAEGFAEFCARYWGGERWG